MLCGCWFFRACECVFMFLMHAKWKVSPFSETHDGVQDMACDTFIKIAQKCRRHFVQVQVGEVMPFIDEILNNINTIICDLQPQQVHTFYEAVGYMIGAQTDQTVQEQLIEKYMLLPNQVWDSIIQQATKVSSII